MVFFFFFTILIEYAVRNREDPDQMPHHVASYLGLHYLDMSHKKDARCICVKGTPDSLICKLCISLDNAAEAQLLLLCFSRMRLSISVQFTEQIDRVGLNGTLAMARHP